MNFVLNNFNLKFPLIVCSYKAGNVLLLCVWGLERTDTVDYQDIRAKPLNAVKIRFMRHGEYNGLDES